MILVKKRTGCKVVITGPDPDGKNTTRSLLVADANVDAVVAVIEAAITAESLRAALAADGKLR